MFGVVTSFSHRMKRSVRCRHFEGGRVATSSASVLLELLLDRLSDDGSSVRSSSLLFLPVSMSSFSLSGMYLRCCHGSGLVEV